jgi:uncharacterized protein (TIGR01777 family)
MRVLITGASGFVGGRLKTVLRSRGHQVLTLGRGASGDFDWSEEGLERGVATADTLVHLAGENLFHRRWSAEQKERIRSSRVETTSRLAKLAGEKAPKRLVSASAVGYYGARDDAETLDETAPAGDDFLAGVCRDWEAATSAASTAGCPTALVRFGVVLGPDGGALAKMLPPFRLGLGGPLGSGRQTVSWIHLDDVASLLAFLVERPDLEGPFNATAPGPVTMKQLSAALGRALRRPAFLPVPGIALKLALGEVADILLTGQRVVPKRALEAGFVFAYPEIEKALEEIVGKGQ